MRPRLLRPITGIGKYNADRYKITTPTATIGVRGSDHEPTDLEAEGASYIENLAGRIEVLPSQPGFAPRGRHKPQRLRNIPAFFRATANEPRIQLRREHRRDQN